MEKNTVCLSLDDYKNLLKKIELYNKFINSKEIILIPKWGSDVPIIITEKQAISKIEKAYQDKIIKLMNRNLIQRIFNDDLI